jgi:hypothetical protein
VGILKEGEGTVYLSRAHGLNPGFLEVEGSMLLVVLALCVMFLFCLSLFCVLCLMLPVSLDFPFFIAPSVFSNVYNTIWLCNLLSERSQ